jgi:hypothetical protein
LQELAEQLRQRAPFRTCQSRSGASRVKLEALEGSDDVAGGHVLVEDFGLVQSSGGGEMIAGVFDPSRRASRLLPFGRGAFRFWRREGDQTGRSQRNRRPSY